MLHFLVDLQNFSAMRMKRYIEIFNVPNKTIDCSDILQWRPSANSYYYNRSEYENHNQRHFNK